MPEITEQQLKDRREVEKKLADLVKAAVELAIVRHDLRNDADDIDMQAIAEDTANAVRGIDTCAEEPIPEWNALVERELRERWIALPNEQGWWWHWNEDRESAPFMYSVLTSLSGAEPRYFIAFPDSRWCDLIGGVWCRAKAPAPPESEGK